MGVLLYLTLLERLIPHQRDWHPSTAEWRWYGVYFLLTMVGSALAQLLVATAVGMVAQPTRRSRWGPRSRPPC
ncbi:hypothetical protein ACFQVA_37660 [Actinomadura keratinilytica]